MSIKIDEELHDVNLVKTKALNARRLQVNALRVKSKSQILTNQNGQGLIQVLISVAIMSIVSMVFASMMSAQYRHTQGLEQKMAVADFTQQLVRSFADGTLCSSILASPGSPVAFPLPSGGDTAANPASQSLTITSIPASILPGAPILASAGNPVSAISSTVVAASPNPFQLTNIVGSSNGTNRYLHRKFPGEF